MRTSITQLTRRIWRPATIRNGASRSSSVCRAEATLAAGASTGTRFISIRSFLLRFCVRTIKEEGHDLLEYFLPDVHGAVNAIGRLDPIHFTDSDLPWHSFSAIAELDVEQVAAQDDGHTMKRVAMPGCRLARRQPLPPNQVISAMMQHRAPFTTLDRFENLLFFSVKFHGLSPPRPGNASSAASTSMGNRSLCSGGSG